MKRPTKIRHLRRKLAKGWQMCPVCKGYGRLWSFTGHNCKGPRFILGDRTYFPCYLCEGNRIIRPEISLYHTLSQ